MNNGISLRAAKAIIEYADSKRKWIGFGITETWLASVIEVAGSEMIAAERAKIADFVERSKRFDNCSLARDLREGKHLEKMGG